VTECGLGASMGGREQGRTTRWETPPPQARSIGVTGLYLVNICESIVYKLREFRNRDHASGHGMRSGCDRLHGLAGLKLLEQRGCCRARPAAHPRVARALALLFTPCAQQCRLASAHPRVARACSTLHNLCTTVSAGLLLSRVWREHWLGSS
jgi:hypothetical protein